MDVIDPALQPDQQVERWDRHVAGYEAVFEGLSNRFAAHALALLAPLDGVVHLDVAAGAGGATLLAAAAGARVTAVDASEAMVARITERATNASATITARVADGMALGLPDASFGSALSCFGVVLFPNPAHGMAELFRVLRPGGRVAIVAWTEPHRYELSARLRAATLAVRGAVPEGPLPAQLRFIDPDRFMALLTDTGFQSVRVERSEAALQAPSALTLATALAFAPGMAAMLDALGPDRDAVLDAFTKGLGQGPITLHAVAHIATGTRPGPCLMPHALAQDQVVA